MPEIAKHGWYCEKCFIANFPTRKLTREHEKTCNGVQEDSNG